MMLRRILLAALAVVAGTLPARALPPVSATSLGTNIVAAASVTLTTTTNDCPVGSLIVVGAAYSVTGSLTSVTDSAGNTYVSPIDNIAGTGGGIAWSYAINTGVDLPIGGTITANFATATTTRISVICVQGIATSAPLDRSNNTAQGLAATSATTVTTPALRQTHEIVVGGLASGSAVGTNNCGTGYTKQVNGSTGAAVMVVCTIIVSSQSAVSFLPTWTSSVNYVTDVITFSDTPIGVSVSHNLGTLGVGR